MKYSEAINLALSDGLEKNRVILYGLGVPDGVFGTTTGLKERFPERVFDIPTSENAMTGIGLGLSISGGGFVPVLTHQRLDFALLSCDQIVNNIAKWNFMFGRKGPLSFVIRMIVGRGWGQGPTHSQNLQAWFAHIPGLDVYVPTFPRDAYRMMKIAIRLGRPVIFIEHRWLHNSEEDFDEQELITMDAIQPRKVKSGDSKTVVATGTYTIEAMRAFNDADIFDLKTLVHPVLSEIVESLRKTKRLIVLDPANGHYGVGSHLVATLLRSVPGAIADQYAQLGSCPTFTDAQDYYIEASDLNGDVPKREPYDVPDSTFSGPF